MKKKDFFDMYSMELINKLNIQTFPNNSKILSWIKMEYK
jgi:hypothetical protein